MVLRNPDNPQRPTNSGNTAYQIEPTALALFHTFATAQRPMLIHCKSGADRSGLAAALYLILVCDAPVATALRQLHWRYLHFSGGPRGVLDHMIRRYGAAQAARGVALQDWIATDYDPVALTAEFTAGRR